jgi:hypothetical protein
VEAPEPLPEPDNAPVLLSMEEEEEERSLLAPARADGPRWGHRRAGGKRPASSKRRGPATRRSSSSPTWEPPSSADALLLPAAALSCCCCCCCCCRSCQGQHLHQRGGAGAVRGGRAAARGRAGLQPARQRRPPQRAHVRAGRGVGCAARACWQPLPSRPSCLCRCSDHRAPRRCLPPHAAPQPGSPALVPLRAPPGRRAADALLPAAALCCCCRSRQGRHLLQRGGAGAVQAGPAVAERAPAGLQPGRQRRRRQRAHVCDGRVTGCCGGVRAHALPAVCREPAAACWLGGGWGFSWGLCSYVDSVWFNSSCVQHPAACAKPDL